ncbi:LamG domain-containing protein, partial [Ancylomarina sp. DW003]
TPGTVDFSIDLASLGIPTALDAADYSLLIDGDGTFATGATAHTTGAAINSGVLSFTGVSFSDGDFFTIAVNDLNTPGAASGLLLWLRADAGVTGTTPISNWSDQSGYGFEATVPANGPDLVTDGLNFNPTLDFTRSNSEYLSIVNGILGTNSYSDMWVYYVSKSDILTNNTVFNENLTGSEYFASLNVWGNSRVYLALGSGAGWVSGNWGGTLGEFNLWTLGRSGGLGTPNGTRETISRDGLVILSDNGIDATTTGNNNNLYIGGRWTGANNYYLDGQLAELIIYTSVPTPL